MLCGIKCFIMHKKDFYVSNNHLDTKVMFFSSILLANKHKKHKRFYLLIRLHSKSHLECKFCMTMYVGGGRADRCK